MDTTSSLTREEIANYIRLYGSSSSVTLLDPNCGIFYTPSIYGIIGYRLQAGCAVVFGDPVCASEDKPKLASAFDAYCKIMKIRPVYMTISEEFASWAMKNICMTLIEVGKELSLDPHFDPKKGPVGRTVRRKVSHAVSYEVKVKEYNENDLNLKEEIQKVGALWLKSRKGPQIYFSEVDLEIDYPGKRVFYAMKAKQVLGVLVLNKLESRSGWLIHLVIVVPNAPNGTSELLVTTVLETLRNECCHFVSFGVSQDSEIGQILGLNELSSWLTRRVFRLAKRVFSLDGRRKYWEKYQPKRERSFLMFTGPKISVKEWISLKKALNVSF